MSETNQLLWAPDVVIGNVESTGGVTYFALTATAGEVWEVVSGLAYHDDDAASRNIGFYAFDGTDEAAVYQETVAASVWVNLQKTCSPVVVGGDFVLRVYGGSLVAGHKLYYRFVIRKLRGMGAVSNE